jgi:hypothetical protein
MSSNDERGGASSLLFADLWADKAFALDLASSSEELSTPAASFRHSRNGWGGDYDGAPLLEPRRVNVCHTPL